MGLVQTLMQPTTVTGGGTTQQVTNVPYRGVYFIISVTAISAATSMDFKIRTYNLAEDKYVDYATMGTISAIGVNKYLMYPLSGADIEMPLPGSYLIDYTITGTDASATISISANYLL